MLHDSSASPMLRCAKRFDTLPRLLLDFHHVMDDVDTLTCLHCAYCLKCAG